MTDRHHDGADRAAGGAGPGSSRTAAALLAALALGGCTPKYVTNVPVEACPASAEGERRLRVDGIATVQVSPDVVDVPMTLTTQAERPGPAMAKVQGQRDGLVAALRAAGLEAGDLRLGNVDVAPRHHPPPEQHRIEGYEASITVVATLSEFARIGEIMELGATFGVTRMHTRFRSTKLPQFKMQARELALAAAGAKAAQMARRMNVLLGEVIAIEEVSSDRATLGLDNVNVLRPTGTESRTLQPGALPLTLSVEVTYALTSSHPGYAPYAPSRP